MTLRCDWVPFNPKIRCGVIKWSVSVSPNYRNCDVSGVSKIFLIKARNEIFAGVRLFAAAPQLCSCGAKATIDCTQTITHGCAPTKFYLWTLTSEFHMSVLCHEIFFFFRFLWAVCNRKKKKHSPLQKQRAQGSLLTNPWSRWVLGIATSSGKRNISHVEETQDRGVLRADRGYQRPEASQF